MSYRPQRVTAWMRFVWWIERHPMLFFTLVVLGVVALSLWGATVLETRLQAEFMADCTQRLRTPEMCEFMWRAGRR
jgi:hypothetical protein